MPSRSAPDAPDPIRTDAPPLGGPIVAAQEWRNAAFLHWRIRADEAAPLLPRGVRPDLYDGTTWVGLIAFELAAARIGPLPPIPHWGTFTEVNVRLYTVDGAGRRGVVFRSLEASRLPAVLAARALFSLPYVWARTGQRELHDGWDYASRRVRGGVRSRLRVAVDRDRTVDDGLSRFLTARWGLHQRRGGGTLWLPNAHEPWTLHPARAVTVEDGLLAAAGLPGVSERVPDSALFSPGVSARFGRGSVLP